MANTVSKMSNTGIMYTGGQIDEVTLNPTGLYGGLSFTSSQFLSIPATSVFQFTGDFTIEAWINMPTTATGGPYAIWGTPSNGGLYFDFRYYQNTFQVSFNSGSGTSIGSTGPIAPGAWYHVAVVRSGSATGNVKVYVNGVSIGNTTNTSTLGFASTTSTVGQTGGEANQFVGIISNLRIANVAVYTGTFTVPTSRLETVQLSGTNITALTGTETQLLLKTEYDNPFKDSSVNAFTLTNSATAVTTSTQHPFNLNNYYSNRFNSSSSTVGPYLTAPANVKYAFGTGDFTVECWVYLTASTASAAIVGSWTGTAATSAWVMTQGTTATNLRFGVANTTVATFYEGTGGLALNQWIHVAEVRKNKILILYSNGVQVYSTGVSQNISYASQALQINGINGSTFLSQGYISNLRIVTGGGVYSSFVPTSALTNVANTQLLACQSVSPTTDNSSSPQTITNVGSVVTSGNSVIPFDGTYSSTGFTNTNYLNVVLSPTFNPLTTTFWTIEGWLYFTSLATSPCLVSGLASGTQRFYIQYNGSTLFVGDAITNPISFSIPLVVNTWYHIAVVNNNGTLSLYINGGLITSVTNTLASNAIDNLIIGVRPGFYITAGYVSNVRFVRRAMYTATNFAPPTKPFKVTQSASIDPVFNNNINAIPGNSTIFTSLLTCQSNYYKDNGANNVTITPAGTTTLLSTSSNTIPTFELSYANTGIAVSKQYSNGVLQTVNTIDEISMNTSMIGSVLLNGSTQYLRIPHSTQLSLTLGDFTIEGWISTNSFANSPSFFYKRATRLIFSQIGIAVSTAGRLALLVSNAAGSAWTINDTTSMPVMSTGTWYHIAVVRNGGNIQAYLDGVQYINSTAIPATITIRDDGSALTIGASAADGGGVSLPYDGYISNFRIVKGKAVYTGNFTPPTRRLQTLQNSDTNISAITDVASTSLLLNTYKTGYEDGSLYSGVNTITSFASPTISKTSPFLNSNGYFSNFFNGTNQYLTTNASSPTSQDFTIECWFNTTGLLTSSWTGSYGAVLFSGTNANAPWILIGGASSTPTEIQVAGLGNSASYPIIVASGLSMPLNTWHHLAISRVGSTFAIWLNGVKLSLTITGTPSAAFAAGTFNIGYNSQAGGYQGYFPGYISNVRYVRGNAVYDPSGGNITVPTSPLTATSNTLLLTCQSGAIKDSSTNSSTITNNGVTVFESVIPFSYIAANTTPTITANTTVRKQYNSGVIQVINNFDDSTYAI